MLSKPTARRSFHAHAIRCALKRPDWTLSLTRPSGAAAGTEEAAFALIAAGE
jgi:hypothetical protein